MEHEWTSLTINGGGGPRIEERHFDSANMLSLEGVNINLNNDQADGTQSFQKSSNSNSVTQDHECNVRNVGIGREVLETVYYPHLITGVSNFEHAPSSSGSSNPFIDTSGGIGFMLEDGDDRSSGSLDGRRLACKRKIIEGFPGQSSASGSASFFQQNSNGLSHSVPASYGASTSINLSSSSSYLSVANCPEQRLNARFGTITRGMASECFPSPSVGQNVEHSRNFRMRISSRYQHDVSLPNLYAQGNTIGCSSVWLPHHSSSLIPFNQAQECRLVVSSSSSQGQPHIPLFYGLPRSVHPFPWNASNLRIRNSLNFISSEERLVSTREDINSGNIPRNDFPEHAVFVPNTNIRHLVQDPTNWTLFNGSIRMTGTEAPFSRSGTSSGVHPLLGPTSVLHQNPSSQYPRCSLEAVSYSVFPSGGSDSGAQSNNFLLQRSDYSSTSQENSHQSPAGFRVHQQPYMRSGYLIERQRDGALGVPVLMRSLAGRSRMISEIRNALDHMHRRESLRFEDVFVLDQSVFYGGADLHDRHSDMRLDVDNMSYEELLALEERIGNVSTGLSEETVLKCLKQRNYSSIIMESSIEEEPCCICQEEYNEGEDVGILDCGHDFHAPCIKQWLMHKNLCPICKTTALVA